MSSPVMGMDGVGIDAEWHQHWLVDMRLSVSNLSKDTLYILFATQSRRLLGDLKWNQTHGWLHWSFTFNANSLSSGALLSLISLQRTTCCEVMYWSQQSVSLCWKQWCQRLRKYFFCDSKVVQWILWLPSGDSNWVDLLWSSSSEKGLYSKLYS